MQALVQVSAHDVDAVTAAALAAIKPTGYDATVVPDASAGQEDILVLATDAVRFMDGELLMHRATQVALMNLALQMGRRPTARAYVLVCAPYARADVLKAALAKQEATVRSSIGTNQIRFFADAGEMTAAITENHPAA